jgi:hypothetical protein
MVCSEAFPAANRVMLECHSSWKRRPAKGHLRSEMSAVRVSRGLRLPTLRAHNTPRGFRHAVREDLIGRDGFVVLARMLSVNAGILAGRELVMLRLGLRERAHPLHQSGICRGVQRNRASTSSFDLRFTHRQSVLE